LEAINIPVKADYSSVIAWENQLYIVAAQNLYSTIDGINWTKVETEQTRKDYFKHHWYLSTHTFYPSTVKDSTAKLQEFGFDVELIDDTKG
jgi:hypothetical protein